MQIPRCTPSLTPLLATLLAIGCGAATPESDSSGAQSNVIFGSRVHKMPKRDSGINPNSAPAGAHLTYYGGRVNAATQAIVVLWGTGSYESHVTSTGTPSMLSFYNQVLSNGSYSSWLNSEYNTVNNSFNGTKTNQNIGNGAGVGVVTITPSVTSTTVDDSQIQSELAAQIQAGHLPAPAQDSQGNATSYYAVFFPHGITITQGGSNSCQAGGFCAYHGTVQSVGGHEIYYGVHPDMQSGSGCDTGCGSASTAFGNYTSVASHELTEMVTDAEVGLATTSGPPLAWYDNTNGEIGDICNAQQGTYTACDGQSYSIQLEFSNAQNNCIGYPAPSCGTSTPDFSISASAASVQAGSSGSSTVSTTASGGSGTVSLSLSGVPSGVTATLGTTSVTAGSGTTISISVGSSVAAGTYSFTVNGSEGTKSHSATVSLSVTSSGGGGGGGGGGAIVNGDFEAGSLSGWTASGASESVVSSGCHGGTDCARLGSTSPTNGDSSIAQTFTPSSSGTLSVWYKETCPDTVTYDWALATLKDNTAGTTATLITKACSTNSWTQKTASVTGGHSYTLTLTSHDDNYASDPTYTLYDDVSFTSGGGGGGGPPPTGGVTNGDFEAGSLTGWTASGAHTAISSTSHSGGYAALAGNTSPTNGDSTLTQTFTAPSGTSRLSLYYATSCPDTITYDWVLVTLKDNTTGTTVNVVPKACPSSYSWTNAGAAVTAGHSYTLKLTNHDDNYSADPTYTLFDDVVLQ